MEHYIPVTTFQLLRVIQQIHFKSYLTYWLAIILAKSYTIIWKSNGIYNLFIKAKDIRDLNGAI